VARKGRPSVTALCGRRARYRWDHLHAKTQITLSSRPWVTLSLPRATFMAHRGPSLRAAQDRQCSSRWTSTFGKPAGLQARGPKVCCSDAGVAGKRRVQNAAFSDRSVARIETAGWFNAGENAEERGLTRSFSAGSATERYCRDDQSVAEQNGPSSAGQGPDWSLEAAPRRIVGSAAC